MSERCELRKLTWNPSQKKVERERKKELGYPDLDLFFVSLYKIHSHTHTLRFDCGPRGAAEEK